MGSIRKTTAGSYEARYRDPQGRSRSRSFRTKKEAERFLVATAADLQGGAWIDPRLGRITVEQWAAEWTSMRVVADNTRTSADARLRNHILPALGHLPLSAVTPLHVRTFVASLTEKRLAPSSVRSVAQVLSGLMLAAEEAGLIVASPATKLTLPRDRADERVFLTAEQVAAVADTVPPIYRALVLTAAYTGLRWGELAGLKRANVDLLRKRIEVKESLQEIAGHFTFGPPKSDAGRRVVPIPTTLAEELSRHFAAYCREDRALVFTGPDGGTLSRTRFRQRVWVPAMKATGLDPAPTFHDLRHTHVALLIAAGVPAKAIQRQVGHASITTTLDRYGHLLPDMEATIRDGLDGTLRKAGNA